MNERNTPSKQDLWVLENGATSRSSHRTWISLDAVSPRR